MNRSDPDRIDSRKWILGFFSIVLAAVLVLSVAAYAIDPFLQFRVKDNAYLLRGWFVDSGLIENYDYDTLIIGSSMVQNFDMELWREKLGGKPLHIGMGAITANEIGRLMDLAYEAGRADTYYICVDQYLLSSEADINHFPEHLLRKDLLSRLRYLLSYEVWFRYIPIDLALMVLDLLGVTLPEKIAAKKSIDKLGDWRLDFPPGTTGREAVLRYYEKREYSVSEVNTEGLDQRMKTRIDAFMDRFSYDRGAHVFFFPPYSSLFWCDARIDGYFNAYAQAKRYFAEEAAKRGAVVYDFQGADCTLDLDNYRDTTHYLPNVSDWMIGCFADSRYLVSRDNISVFLEQLTANTDRFRTENPDLFD